MRNESSDNNKFQEYIANDKQLKKLNDEWNAYSEREYERITKVKQGMSELKSLIDEVKARRAVINAEIGRLKARISLLSKKQKFNRDGGKRFEAKCVRRKKELLRKAEEDKVRQLRADFRKKYNQ